MIHLYIGDPCPPVCPATCGPQEVPCMMGMDWQGCRMPDFCVPFGIACPPPMGKSGAGCHVSNFNLYLLMSEH